MPEFDVTAYKKELNASTSCDTCKKIPSPKLGKKERYIFISYSHKDYKQVYADLADLYAADIPFWYDEGLPAGQSWDDVVRERMTDPNCAGVIFYLSENLFLSRSIQTEIAIACGTTDESASQQRSYFCVNLTNQTPFDISRKTILEMPFAESIDKMEAQLAWLTTLTRAFSDRITYLSYDKADHSDELLKHIAVVFGIDPDFNIFSFDGASFHSGSGIIEFPNGHVYEGSFENGVFSGSGKMRYPNGNVYEGKWQNGKRHGTGTHTRVDGCIYEGEWKRNKPHGHGIFTFAGGARYVGNWVAGQQHGQGTMTYPDGRRYEGEWAEGKYHGMGKMTNFKGVYEGQWSKGKQCGQGTMTYRNGNVYVGEWNNNMRHGRGTMTYSEGSVYVGDWVEDKRHGIGTETCSDGEAYTGEWSENLRHGQGVLTYADGYIYEGLFVNDHPADIDEDF